MYDLIKDFLVLHYQGGRKDTEFWKHMTSGGVLTAHTEKIIGLCKYRMPNNSVFPGISGAGSWPLWAYILSGTDNLTAKLAQQELELHKVKLYAKIQYEKLVFEEFEKIKNLPDNTAAIRKRQLKCF
jgi:hypothetical protein